MTFKGKYPIRSKIVIDNNIVERVSQFNYLGWDIGFDWAGYWTETAQIPKDMGDHK